MDIRKIVGPAFLTRVAPLGLVGLLCASSPPLTLAFASQLPSRGGNSYAAAKQLRPSSAFALRSSAPIVSEAETAASDYISSGETKIIAQDEEFITPDLDTRSYRAITLANNLTCLLVSDPLTDVEAGSIHINSGHFQDPVHRPGLAHFHEHMLFLGTDKYPSENDFEQYLGRNGGSSNAFTDMEDTNYYFSVSPLDHEADDDSIDDVEDDAGAPPGGKTSAALGGALDRLAQFMIAPIFNASMVERELRAIDSEYLNSVSTDSWRNFQLLKNYANKEHPFVKFGCGNYKTLTNGGDIDGERAELSGGTNPRDDLIQFWQENYQTPKMKLCVVGRGSLDELQNSVEKTFGLIKPPSKEWLDQNPPVALDKTKMFPSEHARYKSSVFDSDNFLGVIREVVPVVEMRMMKLQFSTPPFDDEVLADVRPYRVISHLIGHESVGSLHSLLNEEGLINSLSSGVGIDTTDFSLCSVTISLTPKGLKEKDRVLALVWQWINLIKASVKSDKDGLMAKYHEEMAAMSRVNFKYRENGDPCDFCTTASGMLFSYEPTKLLAGSSLAGEYNAETTSAFLERFTPENCLVTVWAQEFDNDDNSDDKSDDKKKDIDVDSHLSSASSGEWNTEKWYGAKHRSVKIPDNLVNAWSNPTDKFDARLALPKLNEFIPQDFSLRADQEHLSDDAPRPTADIAKDPPKVIVEKPDLRLFHKMDRTFRVPRTHIHSELTSPNPYSSPRQMTLNRLYAKVLRDDLAEYVYDASIAGCSYRVTCVPLGFRVSLSGYSEKLPHLLEVVTSRMLSLIEEMKQGPKEQGSLAQKFEKARESLLRQTKNFRMESPYETCSYMSRMLVEDNVWHVNQYVGEMEDPLSPLTMEECARAAEESLLGRGRAESLCMGNINESEAKEVADIIAQRFRSKSRPLDDDEIPVFKSLKIPTREEAVKIYGPGVADLATPTKIEQVVYSAEEENNAIQLILQSGSEHELGYEGIATQELLSYVAYNSAYDTLRTKEQLGYIVSAFTRKTAGGCNGFAVLVQSSSTLPEALEERCEAWLTQFRQELEEMPEERIAMEAAAVVAQLLERDQKLGDEVSSAWGEILATEGLSKNSRFPKWNRMEQLATYLTVGGKDGDSKDVTAASLKANMISYFDKYLDAQSPNRRAMCARVYCQKAASEFDKNVGKPGVLSNYDDSRHVKQFLASYPTAPYWL